MNAHMKTNGLEVQKEKEEMKDKMTKDQEAREKELMATIEEKKEKISALRDESDAAVRLKGTALEERDLARSDAKLSEDRVLISPLSIVCCCSILTVACTCADSSPTHDLHGSTSRTWRSLGRNWKPSRQSARFEVALVACLIPLARVLCCCNAVSCITRCKPLTG